MEQIKTDWAAFRGPAQELQLPSAPKQFLHYFEEPDRPQTRLDRMLERGMAVSLGRLREDTQYDYKFVGLSHNTLRGAAGGAVLYLPILQACQCTYCQGSQGPILKGGMLHLPQLQVFLNNTVQVRYNP